MTDISIILCVYNGEKWIGGCLINLLNQTVKNKEIIIVDDGSTDNTSKIIDDFIESHKEVKLLRRENKGRCISRLDGMHMAEGRYVGFVDVDDEFEPDMFETMLKAAETGKYDIVECKYDISSGVYADKRVSSKEKEAKKSLEDYYRYMKQSLFSDDIINAFLEGRVHEPLWMRIYKKKIVKRVYHNVISMVDIINKFSKKKCDDMFFTPALFMEAKSYYMIDEIKYHYRFMTPRSSKWENHSCREDQIQFCEILLEAGFFINDYYMQKYRKTLGNKKVKKRLTEYIYNRIRVFHYLCKGKYYNEFARCLGMAKYRELMSIIINYFLNKGTGSFAEYLEIIYIANHLNKSVLIMTGGKKC